MFEICLTILLYGGADFGIKRYYLHFSGFMSVFVVGIICGNKAIFRLSISDKHESLHLTFKASTAKYVAKLLKLEIRSPLPPK